MGALSKLVRGEFIREKTLSHALRVQRRDPLRRCKLVLVDVNKLSIGKQIITVWNLLNMTHFQWGCCCFLTGFFFFVKLNFFFLFF
ncbi:hypothetical protein AGDE_13508 [Angomonas deanei]|nr:hypothetical protein AGDE_13508 [Angomonas deanei]|eukprot:EPY22261.1 hypothetical protein AGDE_13508 [Angomonas deanei]